MTEAAFFKDLALLMVVAGVVAIVSAKTKWPKVIGFILAGALLGPNTIGGSWLVDGQSVQTIGQLGVIFLMFAMGLDFSLTKMKKIKGTVLPIAIADTLVMTWLGFTIGRHALGWDVTASLFLGVAICDSATTMLAKVIDEMHWGSRPFVRYALGSSVCEDIICVGLIALIIGVARGRGLALGAAALSLGGLVLFFLAVFIFGLILLPRLLESISKTHDNEALSLTALAACFFVSWVAYKFDFSTALGAFLIGIVIASSVLRNSIAEHITPLKTMFAAVFFVSIGLMVNPAACFRHTPEILLLTAVVMLGKTLNCSVAAILAGERVSTAVQVGMSMAQIGEFAFMVALMYVAETGDATCPMYDIVIAVSILSTLLNPFMIRWSKPVGDWLEARLPKRSKHAIETYRGFIVRFATENIESRIHRTIRFAFIKIGVIAALNFAVAIIFSILNGRDWAPFSAFFDNHKRFVFCLAMNLFMLGMFVPLVKIARTLGRMLAISFVGNGRNRTNQAIRRIVAGGVFVGVLALYFCEISMLNVNLAPEDPYARWTIKALLLVSAIFGWRFFAKAAKRAVTRFDEALGADERIQMIEAMLKGPERAETVKIAIGRDSVAVGRNVVTLDIRAKTGASVIALERYGETFANVGPETSFRAGDILVAAGNEKQVAALRDLIGSVE